MGWGSIANQGYWFQKLEIPKARRRRDPRYVIIQPGVLRKRSTDERTNGQTASAGLSRRGVPKRARFRAITGVPAASTPTLSPIIRVRLRLGFRACSKGTKPRAEIATDLAVKEKNFRLGWMAHYVASGVKLSFQLVRIDLGESFGFGFSRTTRIGRKAKETIDPEEHR